MNTESEETQRCKQGVGLQLPGSFRVVEHEGTGELHQRLLGIVVHSTFNTLKVSMSKILLPDRFLAFIRPGIPQV